jgi:Uncharacterized protein conserved in bacteria (DUF2330)
MKSSHLSPSVVGSIGVSVTALSAAMSPCAYAFGGFWSSQSAPVNQVAEEILFVDNPDSTITAVVRIKYTGPSQSFAWVIPVPGKPTIGVSSSTVFERLDAATAPQYWLEVTALGTCKQEEHPDAASGAVSGKGGVPSAPDTPAAPVMKIDQGAVGPYDYVNITVDPTLGDPARAATDWLTTNGYDLSSLDGKVLRPYLKDGLHLLAFKLATGTNVGAIRPVTLTYESKRPMIPLRPTSVAAHHDMGIQVWVVGPSQAVPDNYKSLVINEARIDWLTGGKFVAGTLPAGGVGPFGPEVDKPSNYDALVTAAAKEAGGQGFVTELGGPASQYRPKIWSSLDDQELPTISSQKYADGIDAIFAANRHFGGWDGWKDAIEGATTLPAGVTIDEFSRNPDPYRGAAKVDTTRFFQLLHEKVVKPVADTAAMLTRAPYLTRLYSTMNPDEMTVDPTFEYNFDLAQVSNIHIAKQLIQCSPAMNQHDAPWRIRLPQGGVIVGKGSGWPVGQGSMPANLKIVALGAAGSGTVVKDNSEDIGMTLSRTVWRTAGTTGSEIEMPHPPQNGAMIGGTQTVTPHGQTDGPPSPAKPSPGNRCSVSRVGAGTGSALTLCFSLAGVFLALRRRYR